LEVLCYTKICMNKKTRIMFGIILGIISTIIVKAVLLQKITKQPNTAIEPTGLIVGKNAIYIAEQLPSQVVSVSLVILANPGFVVIHEDTAGAPGQILGQSSMLGAGETKNLAPIAISRSTKNGETLFVTLHFDDGDGAFDATKDKSALDSVSGEPVMMITVVSKDASEPGIINP